jgi:hypothetical protein
MSDPKFLTQAVGHLNMGRSVVIRVPSGNVAMENPQFHIGDFLLPSVKRGATIFRNLDICILCVRDLRGDKTGTTI